MTTTWVAGTISASPGNGATVASTATCAAGTKVVGGGFSVTGYDSKAAIIGSQYGAGETWTASLLGTNHAAGSLGRPPLVFDDAARAAGERGKRSTGRIGLGRASRVGLPPATPHPPIASDVNVSW